MLGGKDVVSQFHFAVDKMEGAINSLGGQLEDIVCMDIFIHYADDAAAVTRVHRERFQGIRHTHTLTQAKRDKEGCLVEIQADAVAKRRE
jgi:enamine deaminase RidA (YjgF/YER057c/UK114 family)